MTTVPGLKGDVRLLDGKALVYLRIAIDESEKDIRSDKRSNSEKDLHIATASR